jgi:small subunit ribosomal protein S17
MSDETNPIETDVTDNGVAEPTAAEATATEPTATDPTATEPTTTEPKEAASSVAETDATRSNPRKVREGIVVSDKMDSTLVVAVNERVSHARYGKTVQRTKKLYVHDEKNEAKLGDRVRVQETRPLSKLKRWRLTEVVERAR